jgi:hypothetical protein
MIQLFLTCAFFVVWMDALMLKMSKGEDYFWLFIQGSIITLCGIYFSKKELEAMLEED